MYYEVEVEVFVWLLVTERNMSGTTFRNELS